MIIIEQKNGSQERRLVTVSFVVQVQSESTEHLHYGRAGQTCTSASAEDTSKTNSHKSFPRAMLLSVSVDLTEKLLLPRISSPRMREYSRRCSANQTVCGRGQRSYQTPKSELTDRHTLLVNSCTVPSLGRLDCFSESPFMNKMYCSDRVLDTCVCVCAHKHLDYYTRRRVH